MTDLRKDEEVTLTLGQLSVLVKHAQEEEREACAKVCEELVLAYAGNASATAHQCADEIRARRIDLAKVGEVGIWGEKPWVKTYCGGVPNYCTPVDAVNITPEPVDETAKGGHEPVAWHEPDSFGNVTTYKKWALENGWKPLYTAPPKREWVGLTHEERDEIDQNCRSQMEAMFAVEATLRDKNR